MVTHTPKFWIVTWETSQPRVAICFKVLVEARSFNLIVNEEIITGEEMVEDKFLGKYSYLWVGKRRK